MKQKALFFLVFFLVMQKGLDCCPLDTIVNWQIYYEETLIAAGNILTPIPEGTIIIKDKYGKLKIFYNYDAVMPKWRTIAIISKKDTLYNETKSLKGNAAVIVDLKEILKFENKKLIELEVIYRDDIKDEKIIIGLLKVKIE